MGKRSRKRAAGGSDDVPAAISAPTTEYTDADDNVLELRGSLTLRARQEYADTLHGGLEQEDAWQRATELLFERLAVAWTINDVRTDRQKELLQRFRVASPAERQFVRDSLRAHAAEWFPDIEAP